MRTRRAFSVPQQALGWKHRLSEHGHRVLILHYSSLMIAVSSSKGVKGEERKKEGLTALHRYGMPRVVPLLCLLDMVDKRQGTSDRKTEGRGGKYIPED